MIIRQFNPPPNPDAVRAEREYERSLKAAKERERVAAEHAALYPAPEPAPFGFVDIGPAEEVGAPFGGLARVVDAEPVRGEPLPPFRSTKARKPGRRKH